MLCFDEVFSPEKREEQDSNFLRSRSRSVSVKVEECNEIRSVFFSEVIRSSRDNDDKEHSVFFRGCLLWVNRSSESLHLHFYSRPINSPISAASIARAFSRAVPRISLDIKILSEE